MQKSSSPGHPKQEEAQPVAHDGRVVQRFSDGHIAVIGHLCEQDDLSSTKNVLCIDSRHTPIKGDCFDLLKGVHYQLRSWRRRLDCVYKGKVGQEEVHGGVQRRAGGNGNHMSRLPERVTMCKIKNTTNTIFCIWVFFVRPTRMKTVTFLSFSIYG